MDSNRGSATLGVTRRQGATMLVGVLCLALSPWTALTVSAQSEPPPDPAAAVIAPLASRSLLLDAASIDGRLVVVGERGHILVSDDGASWSQAQVPTIATLTAVHFHDRNLGWAVGHDEVILRSRDGGATWQLLYQDPDQERSLLDVWFADADHGFAIGAYGLFLATADGGDTWEERTISDLEYHLHHVSRSSTGKLYLAAEAGTIYRSDDGGENLRRPVRPALEPSQRAVSHQGAGRLGPDHHQPVGVRAEAVSAGGERGVDPVVAVIGRG